MIQKGVIKKILEQENIIRDLNLRIAEVKFIENHPKLSLKLKLTDDLVQIQAVVIKKATQRMSFETLKVGHIIHIKDYQKSKNYENEIIIIKRPFTVMEESQDVQALLLKQQMKPKVGRPPSIATVQKENNNPEDDVYQRYENGGGPQNGQKEGDQKWSKKQISLLETSNFTPIKMLTISNNDWIIKARVIKKYDIRIWQNDRSQGMLMNLDLADAFGSMIQATFFKEAVEKFEPILKENHVYLFSNGSVKSSNRKYTNINNQFSISFDKGAIVKEVENDDNIQQLGCLDNLQNLLEIRLMENKRKCDIVGVIDQIGQVSPIILKSGEKKLRLSLLLADDTNHCVLFCVWGRDDIKLTELNDKDPTVLYVRNAKISNYCQFSLNSNDESIIEVNPTSIGERPLELKQWYMTQGYKAKLKNLTEMNDVMLHSFGFTKHLQLPFSTPNKSGGAFIQNSQGETQPQQIKCVAKIKPQKFKIISEILHYLNFVIPQVEHQTRSFSMNRSLKFHILGYLSFIKQDQVPYYKACPVTTCRRRMFDSPKGLQCRSCMKYYDNYVPAYSLTARISDFTDCIQVQFYRCHGEALIGMRAQDFLEFNNYTVFNKRLFKNFAMEVEAVYTSLSFENKLIFNCNRIYAEEQWSLYNQYLITILEQYETLFKNQKYLELELPTISMDDDCDEIFDYNNYLEPPKKKCDILIASEKQQNGQMQVQDLIGRLEKLKNNRRKIYSSESESDGDQEEDKKMEENEESGGEQPDYLEYGDNRMQTVNNNVIPGMGPMDDCGVEFNEDEFDEDTLQQLMEM